MKDIEKLKEIMKLMKEFQVDHVEIDGIKVNKVLHDAPEQPKNDVSKATEDDDEALYFSA